MNIGSIKIFFFFLTLILILFQVLFRKSNSKNNLNYLISSIIITSIIILIIVLKLHHFLRDGIGISNTITYTASSIPFVYYFYRFRNYILTSKYFFLLLSIVFIGSGLLLDLLTDGKIISFTESDIVEEIFRILGAMFWMIYYSTYLNRINKS